MLALNKILQKARKWASVRLSRVRYSPSEVFSVLYIQKAVVVKLLKIRKYILIWVTKTVDQAVIDTETWEHCYYLNMYRMSLER